MVVFATFVAEQNSAYRIDPKTIKSPAFRQGF
jgi:hypothetical protein